MKTVEEKTREFSAFMEAKFMEYRAMRGWRATQRMWAKEMSWSYASLNAWLLGERLPEGKNQDLLLEQYPELADLLEVPRIVPRDDQALNMIVTDWPLLTPDEQRRFAEEIQNAARKAGRARRKLAATA